MADQAAAGTYLGGDNIFHTVAPKGSPSDTPQNLTYSFTLGKDHMPGLFWSAGVCAVVAVEGSVGAGRVLCDGQ